MALPASLSSMVPRRRDLEALRVGNDGMDGGPCEGLGAGQEVRGGIEAGGGGHSPSCS